MSLHPPSRRCLAVATAALLAAASPARAGEVTVFAAASLTNAMADIEQRFETATGHDVSVSLAGSSVLARQIQQGAPADVFISANPDWMDLLEADGLLTAGTRFDLLGNALVLIGHDPATPEIKIEPGTDLAARLEGDKLAMALVEAVPAGIYGKAALETLGQWQALASDVVQADNVRAALALVAVGEAPYGVVYASDAAAETGVTVLGTFPAESHPPIRYPAAGIAGRETDAVAAFLDYLRNPAARAAFERHGFAVIAD